MRYLGIVAAVVVCVVVTATAQAVPYEFMNINFNSDTIGLAPTTAAAGNPIQTLQAIGGYDPNPASPPTAASGTVLVGNPAGMSNAVVMTTNPNNGILGALWLDTGFSMPSQTISLGFDISILAAPTVATVQPKFLNYTTDTAGILLGMNAFHTGGRAFLFAVAPTSDTGGVFALRSPDNTRLITFGNYIEGQTYRIDLSADYTAGTVDAYLNGVLSLNDHLLSTGSVLGATTSEFFFHLNGELGYANQVALDNITATNGAIPEPVTMAGLMMGIGGLVTYIRKRRKA